MVGKREMQKQASKKIRFDYREANPDDELEDSLSGEVWSKVRDAWGYRTPPYGSEVVHHIYNSALGAKNDCWSLLITVSPAAHEYVHKCPKHGVVACVWTKLGKKEFDRDEVKDSLGRDLINMLSVWRESGAVTHPYYLNLIQDIEERF